MIVSKRSFEVPVNDLYIRKRDHDINVQSWASNPEMSNNNYVQVPFKKHPNVQTKMSKQKCPKQKCPK